MAEQRCSRLEKNINMLLACILGLGNPNFFIMSFLENRAGELVPSRQHKNLASKALFKIKMTYGSDDLKPATLVEIHPNKNPNQDQCYKHL